MGGMPSLSPDLEVGLDCAPFPGWLFRSPAAPRVLDVSLVAQFSGSLRNPLACMVTSMRFDLPKTGVLQPALCLRQGREWQHGLQTFLVFPEELAICSWQYTLCAARFSILWRLSVLARLQGETHPWKHWVALKCQPGALYTLQCGQPLETFAEYILYMSDYLFVHTIYLFLKVVLS